MRDGGRACPGVVPAVAADLSRFVDGDCAPSRDGERGERARRPPLLSWARASGLLAAARALSGRSPCPRTSNRRAGAANRSRRRPRTASATRPSTRASRRGRRAHRRPPLHAGGAGGRARGRRRDRAPHAPRRARHLPAGRGRDPERHRWTPSGRDPCRDRRRPSSARRAEGPPVVAVGTTTTRALESPAARTGAVAAGPARPTSSCGPGARSAWSTLSSPTSTCRARPC